MEKISGGYIYDTGDEENEETRWQVIDLQGNAVESTYKLVAMMHSKDMGYGKRVLTTEELHRLRETGSPD